MLESFVPMAKQLSDQAVLIIAILAVALLVLETVYLVVVTLVTAMQQAAHDRMNCRTHRRAASSISDRDQLEVPSTRRS